MIADAQSGGSDSIDLPEFQTILSKKLAERDPHEQMLKAFRLFDDD